MDQGRLLVITEVDTVSLAADKAVMDAVRCCGRLRRAKHKQKLMVGRETDAIVVLCVDQTLLPTVPVDRRQRD